MVGAWGNVPPAPPIPPPAHPCAPQPPLQVCPETNQVVINIGLLLLAFPSPDQEGQLR